MNVRQHRITLTNLDTSETKRVKIDEWQNMTERLFRSKDYGAVNLVQTLPIKFPRKGGRVNDEGGYYWILDAKELRGVKTRIQIDIERLNNNTNGYESSFTGILDLRPKGGYNKQDEFIEAKILDSGKFAKFSARDGIDYNVFDLVSSDNVTVSDFPNPYTEATYKKVDINLSVETGNNILSGADTRTSTGQDVYNLTQTIIENAIGDRLQIDSGNKTIYNNTTGVISELYVDKVSLRNNITWTLTPTAPTNSCLYYNIMFIVSFDENDVQQDFITIYTSSTGSVNNISSPVIDNLDFNVSEIDDGFVTVPINGYVEMYFTVETFAQSNITAEYSFTFSLIQIDLTEKTLGRPDNQIRGLYSYESLTRLVQLMTSETDTSKLIQSEITGRTNSAFQTYASDGFLGREFITNGYQLRQFVNRALNLSFKKIFKSLNSKTPIGVWYDKTNDYFVIEDIEQFYLPELYSFDLGQVKDIKTTDFTELYFNKILTGYPKVEYEDFQGVNEVNSETEHEISIEEKKSYDIRSPYYGDTIGQERARRKNIDTAASEDTKEDKNVYLTTLNTSDETIQGDLSNLSGFKGIDQYYNLTKTPRQNLQRHLKIVQAPLYKDINEIISFRKSVKDTNISYTDPETGNNVNEFDNLTQYAIENNIIDPELDEFEFTITEAMANEIAANPHKIVPYSDRENNSKYGYIWELEFNRYSKESTAKLVKTNANRVP